MLGSDFALYLNRASQKTGNVRRFSLGVACTGGRQIALKLGIEKAGVEILSQEIRFRSKGGMASFKEVRIPIGNLKPGAYRLFIREGNRKHFLIGRHKGL